jgi:hypothetical protein
VVDICAGGARLRLVEPLWVGCGIRLQLVSEDPAIRLQLLGTVVRHERIDERVHDAGVQFVGVTAAERVQVTRFVLALAGATEGEASRIVSSSRPTMSL